MNSEEGGMRGYWSGHKVLDPTELEARFCIEDGLAFLDVTGNETLSDEGAEQLKRVRRVLHLIPDREADFVHLYHFLRLKQTEIADIFRVSQPTVCYRLQRAALRIRFLLSLPEIEDGELEAVLEEILADPLDIEIMLLMHETTCQSEVAKRLGVSQGLVRHRFIRTIEKMGWEQRNLTDEDGEILMGDDDKPLKAWFRVEAADVAPGIEKYATMFRAIADNLNILREVQRPSWGPRITHALE
jgi:DNA-directed RNA polymerase specialized sigma24 family protein